MLLQASSASTNKVPSGYQVRRNRQSTLCLCPTTARGIRPCHNTCMRLAAVLLPALLLHADPITLTYYGVNGWQITDGKVILLIDPYFTRAKYPSPNDDVSPDDPRPLVNGSSIVEPDTAVIDAHIAKADYIFLTHTHPDHSLDMPYIARKTGAGNESVGIPLRMVLLPESKT